MGLKDMSDLRHRIILEEPIEVEDQAGGVTRNWQTVTTLWAAILPVNGQPEKGEDRLLGTVTHKIIIRARVGITRLHRFSWQNRIFQIRYFSENRERSSSFHHIFVEEERP